jgi:hypothetical protein
VAAQAVSAWTARPLPLLSASILPHASLLLWARALTVTVPVAVLLRWAVTVPVAVPLRWAVRVLSQAVLLRWAVRVLPAMVVRALLLP